MLAPEPGLPPKRTLRSPGASGWDIVTPQVKKHEETFAVPTRVGEKRRRGRPGRATGSETAAQALLAIPRAAHHLYVPVPTTVSCTRIMSPEPGGSWDEDTTPA
jgi:hypothetical protein